MPAYQNLPWLTGSDQFLQAMLAGGQAGLAREKMRNDLAQETLRRFSFGGGGGGGNPLAAQSQAWREQYQQQLLDDADQRLELSEDRNRIAEQGAGRFQFLQPGLGQISRANPLTGEIEMIQEPRDTTREPTVSVPMFPPGVDPAFAGAMGMQPTTIRGGISQVAPYAGTNLPPALRGGMTAPAPVGQPQSQPFSYIGSDQTVESPPTPGVFITGKKYGTTPPVPRVRLDSGVVRTKSEYDALPSGTVYIGEDGKKYRKP